MPEPFIQYLFENYIDYKVKDNQGLLSIHLFVQFCKSKNIEFILC